MRIEWIELTNYIGIYNGIGLNNIKIDFRLCRSNKILIKGLNGSGKSTIFNALSVFPDSNDSFINGMEARKNICVNNDGIEYIIKYIHGIDKSGNRTTSKGYISKNINGVLTELNPNGNISSCKEIIHTEFSLDLNFMALSQLSTESRGMAYMIPSSRKKFVTNIINELEVYNNINKIITKKSSMFKNTINSLMYKISNIGDEMTLQLNLKSVEDRLNILNAERDKIYNLITIDKVKVEEISNILKENNYESICNELNDLTNLTMSLSKDIITKLEKYDNINNFDELESYAKKIDAEIISIDSKIEQYRLIIPTKLAERESEAKELQDKTEKLNALQSDYNYIEIKKAVNSAKETINKYDILFKEMGLNNAEIITKDEFDTAMESLVYLKELAMQLPRKYSNTDLNTAYSNRDKIMSDFNNLKSLKASLQKYNQELYNLDKEIAVFNTKRKMASELLNRPKDCKIDSCYFIKAAIQADEEYPEVEYNNKLNRLNELKSIISNLETTINDTDKYHTIINDIIVIERELQSRFRFISKLPINNNFKNNFIIRAINGDLFSDIDELYKYSEYGNFIEEYKIAKENLHIYEVEYKIYESKNDLIESILNDIKSLTNKVNVLANEIEKINNDITELEATKQKYVKISDITRSLLAKYNDEFLPADSRKKELEKVKQSLEGKVDLLYSIQASINDKCNALGSKDAEIQNASNERDELKHKSIMLKEYQQELQEYNNKYTKIEKIKYYSSPSTGIQTLFMELYMNNALSIANDLLSLLFSGEFALQPFIINENEFRIPCIGSGIMHDDISSMSTAQKCMISMILSFSLLCQSSTKYNIIKLDEIDGGLDSINRPFFITLLDRLMNMLNCEQSFIISHNSELDDTSCDVILLKDDPYNSLVSSKANVIWKLA